MRQEALRIRKSPAPRELSPAGQATRISSRKSLKPPDDLGCKACEVACMGGNDLRSAKRFSNNTLQDHAGDAWNYWNLILFNEHVSDKKMGSMLGDAQEPVHALCGAVRLAAALRTTPRQYTMLSSIFSKPTIRVGLLHHGMPVRHFRRLNSEEPPACSSGTVVRIASARPRTRVHQVRPPGLPDLAARTT